MVYDRLFEEFIDEIKEEGTYASADEIREATKDTLNIIKDNKDSTPEEIIELIIKDNIELLEAIKNKYPVPGYTVGVSVDNIDVKLTGGNLDYEGRKMRDDALFDLASMTKFYTQVIAYNLIKEGYFSLEDKIKDLDPRFENLGNLTVNDILTFTTKFQTDGRLDAKSSSDEAYQTLLKVKPIEVGKYNYNDLGMMIMKEVMEYVTITTYPDLVEKYITDKYKLHDTHLILPNSKIYRATGSANDKIGKINDPSALALGGFSGHAGMFASSDDLIKLGKAVHDGLIPEDMISNTYTPGVVDNRGIMGNTYTSHERGIDRSYVDRLEPKKNFAIQGSTRVQMNIGEKWTATALLNPASMGIDAAMEMEKRINAKLKSDGKAPVHLIKDLYFGDEHYKSFDVRQMAPGPQTIEPIATSNAVLALRLRLLNKFIKEYDKSYNKKIEVNKSM